MEAGCDRRRAFPGRARCGFKNLWKPILHAPAFVPPFIVQKDVWAVLRENIHRYQDNFSAYLKAENRFKKKKELVIQEPIV